MPATRDLRTTRKLSFAELQGNQLELSFRLDEFIFTTKCNAQFFLKESHFSLYNNKINS